MTSDYPEAAYDPADSMAEANRILSEAGWSPIPKPCWGGGFTMARQVGGVDPWGTQFVKGLDIVPPGDPRYGPDTPDEHHEAAAWLVEHAKALHHVATPAADLTTEVTLAPVNIVDPLDQTQWLAVEPEAAAIAEVEGLFGEAIDDLAPNEAEFSPANEKILEETTDAASAPAIDEGETVDAEFWAEKLNAAAAEPLALDDFTVEDLGGVEGEEPPSVAYFGDNIHTIRLAKMGRLSQRARELKATLQQGWTLERFAYLQNLIVRIDRKEAPDDDAARAEFLAINERSAAMARVDAYRELREAELEAADRAGVEAFDPEASWP